VQLIGNSPLCSISLLSTSTSQASAMPPAPRSEQNTHACTAATPA